ncbi:MAG: hypothetical protein WC679_03205 [Bacteroidales bacterium]|jgi:hypothetical protein
MDEYEILLIAFVISVVIAFFLSSFYVKNKTKDMDLEAKGALYVKNKKTRKLFSYFFIAYMLVNLIIVLLMQFNVFSGFRAYSDISSLCYTYGLVLIAPIGFFYSFTHYKLERIVFGRIL